MPPKKRSVQKVNIMPDPPSTPRKPIFLILLLVVMAISAAYLLIKQGFSLKNAPESSVVEMPTPEEVVLQEGLLDKVKRHILITNQSDPRIFVIGNIDAVRDKNPKFYANAQDGDKVLIWEDQAMIYSEADDRLVSVANAYSLIDNVPAESEEVEAPVEPTVSLEQLMASTTIEIRNGSRVNGAAGRLQRDLKSASFNVLRVSDAKNVYEGGPQFIDMTGGTALPVLNALIDRLGGAVTSTLPTNEPAPVADILILMGK